MFIEFTWQVNSLLYKMSPVQDFINMFYPVVHTFILSLIISDLLIHAHVHRTGNILLNAVLDTVPGSESAEIADPGFITSSVH